MIRLAAQSLLIIMLCLSPATAGAKSANSDCAGAFGRDASHAGLVKAFGASNIAREDVFMYGDTMPMTVVFHKDPQRRLAVHWRDEKQGRGIERVVIRSPA